MLLIPLDKFFSVEALWHFLDWVSEAMENLFNYTVLVSKPVKATD